MLPPVPKFGNAGGCTEGEPSPRKLEGTPLNLDDDPLTWTPPPLIRVGLAGVTSGPLLVPTLSELPGREPGVRFSLGTGIIE